MSDDIVERLREEAIRNLPPEGHEYDFLTPDDMLEGQAADEISRLRTALAASEARLEHLTTVIENLTEHKEACEADNARLRTLLEKHHHHHLTMGEIGLPDGRGGWVEIDNGAEYSDSSLYEQTQQALAATERLEGYVAVQKDDLLALHGRMMDAIAGAESGGRHGLVQQYKSWQQNIRAMLKETGQ